MAKASATPEERCSWCGAAVDEDDGYRLFERPGERRAVFCRLEHLVPWAIRGPHWERGADELADAGTPGACAHCGKDLGDTQVVLVRHRGQHRVPDAFCSVDHAFEWAKSGGRYR